jgi:hypothetical protein
MRLRQGRTDWGNWPQAGNHPALFMKCLDETAEDVARRMRALAAGVSDAADAQAIRRYADWIESTGIPEPLEAGEQELRTTDSTTEAEHA